MLRFMFDLCLEAPSDIVIGKDVQSMRTTTMASFYASPLD